MARIAVLGLGSFGLRLARELTAAGAEVIAADQDRNLIDKARDDVTLAVCMDTTDPEALASQGIDKVSAAIVSMGEAFEANALTVSTLKSLDVPRVIARASTPQRGEILRRIGADEIVLPEEEAATRWATRLMLPNLKDYVELGEGAGLVQIDTPKAFVDQTPLELKLRQKYRVSLVLIRRPDGKRTNMIVPQADTKLLAGDSLVLIGADDDLAKLPG